MLHKLPKYLVWIGAFLFVAMFPVGELCAQNNLCLLYTSPSPRDRG